MESILVSAMLQSQQVWLPALSTPTAFIQQIGQPGYDRKFIAHCLEEQRVSLARIARQPEPVRDQGPGEGNSSPASPVSSLILIGPEGDFSKKEIESALQQGYEPVTLGETRLRTETAGVVAATLLCVG
jgi:16S rRNA (uracil1498-N3)-methyltransferase